MNLTKRPVATKGKKCKVCKGVFTPTRPLQSCCSVPCAIKHSQVAKAKKERIEHRVAKEKLKSRADWMREAQQAFNAYIRARDKGLPCISCGKPTKQGDHAGHWKPTSSSPELRFDEFNVSLQCVQCNVFFHGNVANYRQGLISRFGQLEVDRLESKHEPKHYSIDDLKAIKSTYKQKLKELS